MGVILGFGSELESGQLLSLVSVGGSVRDHSKFQVSMNYVPQLNRVGVPRSSQHFDEVSVRV